MIMIDWFPVIVFNYHDFNLFDFVLPAFWMIFEVRVLNGECWPVDGRIACTDPICNRNVMHMSDYLCLSGPILVLF